MNGRSKGSLVRRAALLGVAAFGLAFGVRALAGRYGRIEIAGRSMLPAYAAGDYVIVDRHAYRRRPPAAGEVVLARDPRDPERPIVKRVGFREADGSIYLLGDNPVASTDSRTFGPVAPDLVIGRVRFRYRRG